MPGELDEGGGGGHDGHAAGQGQIALARPQGPSRQVDRHQGRRARRVHRHRRALEAERVGHPAGQDTARAAGHEQALDVPGGLVRGRCVVVVDLPREDSGAAAVQPVRVESGLFEGFPGGFQEQPLLRVHRQRLAWRDPEEARVEVARVVQESAFAGVRGAGVVRVGVVQAVEVPAPVRREAADAVAAGGDQLPQFLGAGDASGVAAGHADDREGFVGGGRGRGGLLPRYCADQLIHQVGGEFRRGGVVEDESCGKAQSGGVVQPVAQFERAERVEAELAEGARDRDAVGRGVAEDGGGQITNESEGKVEPLVGRQCRQALGERTVVARGPRGTDEAAQQGRYPLALRLFTHLPEVKPRGHGERSGVRDGPVEQREGLRLGQRRHAEPGQPRAVGGAEPRRHAAAVVVLVPQAPGLALSRQSEAGPVGGQGVEEGVGGGVVGLSRAAEDAGDRGQEDERGQRLVAGEVVQVPGGVHLGAQYGRELVGRQGGDGSVVEDARRVHHGGEGVVGEGAPQGVVVRGIAAEGGHLAAVSREFGREVAGRLASPAADEDESAYAVLTDQTPGDQAADVSGGAGEQDRAVRTEGDCAVLGPVGDTGEPGDVSLARAQGDLGFVARGDGGQDTQRRGLPVGVGQEEPSGGLGVRAAQETPDGGGGDVGHRGGARRSLGDGEQSRTGQPVVEKQGAGGRQSRGRVGVGRGHRGVPPPVVHGPWPVAHGPYEDVGSGGTGVEGGAQSVEIAVGLRRGAGVPERCEDGRFVIAEEGPLPCGARLAGQRQRLPFHGEQGPGRRLAGGGEPCEVRGQQREGPDTRRPLTRRCGEVEGDGGVTGGGDPRAQCAGAGCGDGDVVEGVRQAHAVLGAGGGDHGVQDGVEEGRVEGEVLVVRGGGVVLGQPRLRVDGVVGGLPEAGEELEGGAVDVAVVGQFVVEAGEVGLGGAGGRPGGGPVEGGGGRCRGGRAQGRCRVVRPGQVGVPGVLAAVGGGPAVHGRGGAVGAVGGDGDLEVRGAASGGQRKRLVQGEFVEVGGAVVDPRVHRQFEQGGSRQQREGTDRVVVEPAVAVRGEPSGQDEAPVARGAQDRAEQRMAGRGEPGGRDVRGTAAGDGIEPVALALEGVGGQRDTTGTGAGVEAGPVHGPAVGEDRAQ